MAHAVESDRNCEYCHMVIQAGIPHECDPSICRTCKGTKTVWAKDGNVTCWECDGTGVRKWK